MVMTDPVADMLTRIRNGVQARHEVVSMPASRLKAEIARILKEEGYVEDYAEVTEGKFPELKVKLKYTPDRASVITRLEKVSKPGLRIYVNKDKIPSVLNGMGVAIISTSRGVMSDAKAREAGVGGEILCKVY